MRAPRIASAVAFALCLAPAAAIGADAVKTQTAEEPPQPKPRVELAILLDTSGSMSGLINQARAHLWEIVNQFESVRRGGRRPDVYVALYEYGNSGLSASDGYLRQIVPLTLDLDKISEELFALTTNGGSEHCGQVIDRAVTELEWSKGGPTLRSIFIAGNEPFTQGPIDYRQACGAAAERGITVSTIHCGDHDTGVSGMWADGAKLADGSYLSINQDHVRQHVESPQDKEIAELSAELNTTYCAYGAAPAREEATLRQAAQDSNASKLAPLAAVNRALTKASCNYRCANWDLVDALKEDKVKLEDLSDDQLPEDLRGMTLDERRAHLESLGERRAEIQAKIQELSAERAKFLAEAAKAQATDGQETLDSAIAKAVRDQATRQQFVFE